MILVAIFTLLLSPLWADSHLSEIMKAQSIDQLLAMDEQAQTFKQKAKGCQWEIEHQHFPHNCLYYIDKLLIKPESIERLSQALNHAESLCQDHVRQIQSVRTIKELLAIPSLPQPCRRQLGKRQRDLEYIQGASALGPDIEKAKGHESFSGRKSLL